MVEAHIVRNPETGRLTWTYQQAPDGTVRHYTQATAGMATLDAESTARQFELIEEEFKISPNVSWTDDLRWMAYNVQLLHRRR